MKYKNQRQQRVLEIIKENNVETQEELAMYLLASGFEVTQATISRDIRDLHLIKVSNDLGSYHYVQNTAVMEGREIGPKAKSIMRDSIRSIQCAQNLVVVKCYSGMAQGVCAAIDTMETVGLIGSLAGDDTIFLAAEDNEAAKKVVSHIHTIID